MIYETPHLETKRLIIDYGTIEDYVKIHEYDFNDLQNINGVTKLTKNNPNDIRSWFGDDIESWYHKVELQNHYQMVVFLKETNEPIGDIGFDRNNTENNSIEASCWLHPDYWGKGYMEEAMIKVMEFIFDKGFDNIVAGYVEGNNRSKRLQEKLGFLPYGYDDDFQTNYGHVREYKNIMSKGRFKELYKNTTLKTK